jgi:hypothetical protein
MMAILAIDVPNSDVVYPTKNRRNLVSRRTVARWRKACTLFAGIIGYSLGFPGAGGAVRGEQLHSGGQFTGRGEQLTPDPVLGKAVQRQVRQPGVLAISWQGSGIGSGGTLRHYLAM